MNEELIEPEKPSTSPIGERIKSAKFNFPNVSKRLTSSKNVSLPKKTKKRPLAFCVICEDKEEAQVGSFVSRF